MKENDVEAFLSIIIPFKDRTQLLESTLLSLEEQKATPAPIHLIFVDNGSQPHARNLVVRWIENNCPPFLKGTLTTELQPGAAAARNCGLRIASTQWVMFFDSDDIMLPSHLKDVSEAITANTEADIIYWNVTMVDGNGRSVVKKPHCKSLATDVVIHSVWSTQRYAVKTAFLRSVGSWDADALSWNDWELSVRLLLASPLSVYVPSMNNVRIMVHPQSITGNNFTRSQGRWEYALQRALSNATKASSPKLVSLILAKMALLAAEYSREGNREGAAKLMKQALSHPEAKKCRLNALYHWHRKVHRGAFALFG